MENWQEEHIRKNLSNLIELTTCSTLFLAHLAVFLGKDDEAALEAALKSEGKLNQCRLFYDITVKKKGIYKAMLKALFETKQTGAFQVLLKGVVQKQPDGDFGIGEFDPKELEIALKGFECNALSCIVNYQDLEMPLRDVLGDLQMVENLVLKHLTGNLLLQIITNKRPAIVNNSVPDKINYYITRVLTTRSHIDPKLFAKSCKDIFVVEKIQLDELRAVANGRGTDISGNQTDRLTVSFIVLEFEEDYEKICKISSHPVHWLYYENGKFIWLKTHGKISNLQSSINDTQDEMKEVDFIQLCLKSSNPICISDTPGMGKTVLLARLAHSIMKADPTRLVQFIILREFVQQVEERRNGRLDNIDMTHLLISLISEQASELKLGQEIVRELLHSESQVAELMFDGFDELLLSQVDLAKEVLITIARLKSVRLYVATRPHMRDELEKTLGVLGYNILAFGADEQTECLTRYWNQQGATYGCELHEFATRCLETLSKNMKDSERNIAGIPLQCRMLAEVYQDEAIKYSKPERRVSAIDFGMVVKIRSIFDMYQKLVEMRFKKLSVSDSESCRGLKQSKKRLNNAHMFAALQLLFPEYIDTLQRILNEDVSVEARELYALGILEKKKTDDATPRFIHRTFAEYFVGLFAVSILLQRSDFARKEFGKNAVVEFFFNILLFTTKSSEHLLSSSQIGKCKPIRSANFRHAVVCYFINSHLENSAINYQKRKLPWSNDPTKIYERMAACIAHDNLMLFLQTAEYQGKTQKMQLKPQDLSDLTFLSAKHSSIEAFKEVYQYLTNFSNQTPQYAVSSSPKFTITPLHVALERGHFAICDHLINYKPHYEIQNLKYLVHCCVARSLKDNQSTVSQKLSLINVLTSKCRDLVNEIMPDGTTPVLQTEVHVSILKQLFEFEANINAVNNCGCILHKFAETDISPDTYHQFVLSLLEYEFDQFNSTDSKQRSPLHVALQNIELLEDTIQVFHYMKANFNAVDDKCDSIFFYAIRSFRSIDLLNTLLDFEASINDINAKSENALHVCATCGNLKAFECILRSAKFDINLLCGVNNLKLTPFVQALSFGKGLSMPIIELMDFKGFRINKDIASDGLKGLLCNKNIFAWELGSDFVKVADYLLEKGSLVKYQRATSAWELETTKTNQQSILDGIKWDESLKTELAKRGLWETNTTPTGHSVKPQYNTSVLLDLQKRGRLKKPTEIFEQPPDLVFKAIQSSKQSSFERLCISLVACNQITPFLLLKRCVQYDAQKAVKFVTPTNGLVEFMESKEELIIFIRSWNCDLTKTRIKNWFDDDALVLEENAVSSEIPESNLTLVHCETLTEDFYQTIASVNRKIMCLCHYNKQYIFPANYRVLWDEFSWKDLSSDFRKRLIVSEQVRQEALNNSNHDYLELKDKPLVDFIAKQETSKVMQTLDEYKIDYLCQYKFSVDEDLSQNDIKPLHVAVKRGHIGITKYCLSYLTSTELLKIKYVIHCCIVGSVDENDDVIKNKIIIIELLSTKNKHWIDECLQDGTTPIMQLTLHQKLLECIINLGANVSCTNLHLDNVFHVCAKCGNYEALKHILMSTRFDGNLLSAENNNKLTPFNQALSFGKILPMAIIELMELKGYVITKDIASDGLKGLLCNKNMFRCELESEYVKVVDYLLQKSGLVTCKNATSVWELNEALGREKNLTVPIINLVEKKALQVCKEQASDTLTALFCEISLFDSEVEKNFVDAVDYLLRNGGELKCKNENRPWDLESTKRHRKSIEQATNCNSTLLNELSMRGLKGLENITNSKLLFQKLQNSPNRTSFEILLVSLMGCQQSAPFTLLKLCLQLDMKDSIIFRSPPVGLMELIESQQNFVIILISWDVELSIMRFKDTYFPADIVLIREEDIGSYIPISNLAIYECASATAEIVIKLTDLKRKVICVCKDVGEGLPSNKLFRDEFCWSDLSTEIQDDLVVWNENALSNKYHQLKNKELVDFIRENLPGFMGFEKVEANNPGVYLSLDMFNYFLPDKLAFCGITSVELNRFVKFNHNIGGIRDDVSKLDYLLVQDKQEFEETCKKTSSPVHLIEHLDGAFRLLQTIGSDKNIKEFFKEYPIQKKCDDFPVCTCGNHKVGSENSIWNVYRCRGKPQTYWISLLDVIENLKMERKFILGDLSIIIEVTKLFHLEFDGKSSLELWKQIRKPIGGSVLTNKPVSTTDVIVKLLKFIGLDEDERRQLQLLAVQTLYPKFAKSSEVISLEKFVQHGVLEYTDDTLVFVHKILAWYFIADVVAAGQIDHSAVATELREEILSDCFRSQEVKVTFDTTNYFDEHRFRSTISSFKFDNSMLFKLLNDVSNIQQSFTSKSLKLKMSDEFLEKWVRACIFGNHFHLLKIVVSLQTEQKIFQSEDLVVLAIMYADVLVIEFVVEKFVKETNKQIVDIEIKNERYNKNTLSLLHVAALRGSCTVMQYFLNDEIFKAKLRQPNLRNILAYCVYDTRGKPDQVSDRKRMVRLLLENVNTLINGEDDEYWISPLLVKNIDFDIINYFISLGVDVHATNDAQNIMHVCSKYVTLQQYHELIQLLHERGESEIFHTRDRFEYTPLHYAVRDLEVLDSTLELFSLANGDFNAKTNHGDTVLIWAVWKRRSLRLIDALIRYGADFHQRGEYNRTVLHEAADCGNLSALRYFISKGCDINAKDEDEDTPLHLALTSYTNDNCHDTVQILVQNGADVNAINKNQQTPNSLALAKKDRLENRTLEVLRNAMCNWFNIIRY